MEKEYLKKILFVCMGNICRSPAAEGIFKKLILDNGLEKIIFVDSAGTIDYHSGELPDSRMRKAGADRGYEFNHISRKFNPSFDFDYYDYIFYMDNQNYKDISMLDNQMKYSSKLFPTSAFCKRHKVQSVPDPYYGTIGDFNNVIDILEDGCQGILERLKKEIESKNQR